MIGSKSDGGGGGGGGRVLKKGPWTAAEDAMLMEYVRKHGEGNWNAVQKNSALARCGKSCRLRWANHLRPNLKKGSFSPEEERLILHLHSQLGNKWARMAAQLPGRTDNEIKNYWNTRVKRRLRAGLPLHTPDLHNQPSPQSHLSFPHSNKPPVNLSSTITSSFLTHQTLLPIHQLKPVSYLGQSQIPPISTFNLNPQFNGLTPFSTTTLELPSSQLFQTVPYEPGEDNTNANRRFAWSNSRLLDAVLQESQALVGSSNSKRQKLDLQENQQSGLVSNVQIVTTQWDDSSSVHSSKGLETKEEPVDQINSIHADLSTFFDIIPTDTWVPQWYGDSGEISNGQSSAVTDDNVGFEMQQLSFPSLQLGSTSGHEWTLSPCSWSSTPGVC